MTVNCPHCKQDHEVDIGVSDHVRHAIEAAVLQQIHSTLTTATRMQTDVALFAKRQMDLIGSNRVILRNDKNAILTPRPSAIRDTDKSRS